MGVVEIHTDDLLSVDQACKETGITIPTMYRWISKEKVNAIKLGGILYIPRTEVERLKKDGTSEESEVVTK